MTSTPINDLLATGLSTAQLAAAVFVNEDNARLLMRRACRDGAARFFGGNVGYRVTREWAEEWARVHIPKPRYATR